MGAFTYETQMPTAIAMMVFAVANFLAAFNIMLLRRRDPR